MDTSEDSRRRLNHYFRCWPFTAVDRFDDASRVADDGIEAARRDRQAWALRIFETWKGLQSADLLSPLVFAGQEERDPWPWKPGWLRMLAQIGMRAGDEKFTDEVLVLADLHPDTGWRSLTESEMKVARLIGAGYTNKGASDELGVSVNTVGTHLRSAFTKLGVRSRVQLSNAMHEHATA